MTEQHQTFIWQQRTNQQLFAELCNALYERELTRLAQEKASDIQVLQKRIASLPYYIKKAAEHIVELYVPMDLDSQNGSWLYTQSTKPFSEKQKSESVEAFYCQHAKMALVVPIAITHYGIEHIVLDSIDEIEKERVHCNQHGWFSMSGEHETDSTVGNKYLLKPIKATMTAACCGHQWLNGKKTSSRLLSLREMLLATRINWKQFSKLAMVKR